MSYINLVSARFLGLVILQLILSCFRGRRVSVGYTFNVVITDTGCSVSIHLHFTGTALTPSLSHWWLRVTFVLMSEVLSGSTAMGGVVVLLYFIKGTFEQSETIDARP